MCARLVSAVLGGILLFGPVGLFPAPAAAQGQTALAVKVGGSRSIPVSEVTRVAVGDPEIADIRVDRGNSLLVTGRSVGSTTVVVWNQSGQKVTYSVTVTP